MQIKQGMWLKHLKFGTVDSFDPEGNKITLFFRNVKTKETNTYTFTIEELAEINNMDLRYDPEDVSISYLVNFFISLSIFVAITSFFCLWKIALVGCLLFYITYFFKARQRSRWLERYPNYHKVI